MMLLLDSNLLLLLAIGSMDREFIPRFKRTQQFTKGDFDQLVELISRAAGVLTTPHILSEVSSLANALREDQKDDFAATFRSIISALDERWQAGVELSSHRLFRFGIADVAAMTSSEHALLLTQDGRFAAIVNTSGGYALSLQDAIAIGKQLI